ncbi:hypothetical protein L208DRAFT_1278787 [Tricholoma matsutake]|nr:hypothetical protein L208DRAFT_1278787 [Tricholoma matsutake 945]
MLQEYNTSEYETDWNANLYFVDHIDSTGLCQYPTSEGFAHVHIPLQQLIPMLTNKNIHKISKIHKMQVGSHISKASMCQNFDFHNCVSCNLYVSVFQKTKTQTQKPEAEIRPETLVYEGEVSQQKTIFPPEPLNEKVIHQVLDDFGKDSQPKMLQEAGCAVCGKLTPIIQLSKLNAVKNLLHILDVKGVTRKTTDQIEEDSGPVLNKHSDQICDTCRHYLQADKMPPHALANGLWVGETPPQLSSLRFVEKLLIQ